MKKTSLKIALALLLSSTLFFSCAKEETSVSSCANVSASIVNDVNAYTAAATKFSTAPTTANCLAVRTSLTAIIDKVKDCPQFAAVKTQYELVLKDFTCK